MDTSFHASIVQQPDALRDLAAHCAREFPPIEPLAGGAPLLVTGMGASLHAAQIMTYQLHGRGVPALCAEATDLLGVSAPLLEAAGTVVYVSQSGASAEVAPFLAQFPGGARLLAVTNEPDSPLARGASVVLPLHAGAEQWVATKTYANAVALLWLLARHFVGAADGTEFETLRALADHAEGLIAQADRLITPWFDALEQAETLVLLGHGPDGVTARHAAMMLSEWSKRPALGISAGAFRHGFIEQVTAGSGVVCVASHASAYPQIQKLARELAGYGARVILVSAGEVRGADEAPAFAFDPFLAPILDAIAGQLFVEALARRLGVPPGFRYLSKIVTQL